MTEGKSTTETRRDSGHPPNPRRLAPIELASALVAVAYTTALVVFAKSHCYFYGDDYSGFSLALTEPFAKGLLTPVGGQVVPLARALNFAFFQVVGLSYDAALALLCALHCVGMFYVYRALELSKRTPFNAVLVALYACFVYTWVQLGWWIAGLERVPFVACGAAAVFHYLRYRQAGARRDLVIACVCSVVALGFYSKGLLIPLCFIGVDLARGGANEPGGGAFRRHLVPWSVALSLFAVELALSLFLHRAAGVLDHAFDSANLSGIFLFVRLGLAFFASALFGLALDVHAGGKVVVVAVAWLLLMAYTVYRAPRVALGWTVLVALVLLNLSLIGVSNRVGVFGALMAFEVRYYWELCFFTFVILGLIAHQIPSPLGDAAPAGGSVRRALPALGGLLLVAYGVVSYRSFAATAFSFSDALPRTRGFMTNLGADLARLEATGPGPYEFADGDLPAYVIGFDLTFRKHSQLLALMGARVEFPPAEEAALRITDQGTIVPVR
jgi:hypothetical protein